MKKNLKENAETLGISIGYLSQILNGIKGCNEELMLNIKHLYPELDFTLLNPRYILRKASDKCNYMEYRELARKYNIGASSIDWRNSTYNELDNLLNIIMDGKKDNVDKAIEFIMNYLEIDEETGTYSMPYTFDAHNLYKILKMLEGEDNE